MAHSEKQQAQENALANFVNFAMNRREELGSLSEETEAVASKVEQALSIREPDSVYAPVAELAEALDLRHDNLPREELVAQTARVALQKIHRLEQEIRKQKQQALETAQELRGLRHQMLVAGGGYPSLYQIAHKLAYYSPPGVGREAGGRLSVQAQRLDKSLRDIYEKLEADHVS